MKIGTKMMEDRIMKKSLFFAASLLALAACSQEVNIEVPVGDLTFIAKTETSAETKTVVEGETHVYWEPGDGISVFSGEKSGKFTTDITASSATASFIGTLGKDAWTEGMDLWAVYPYSSDAVFSDETITTDLPAQQVARAGSFGKDMNLAIAHSTTSELQFYNVGGGVRFSLSQDGITEVVLEGLNGETLAGKVKVGFQEGKPAVLDVTEGSSSITVSPAEGESFKKDTWYYLVAIPGTLEKGFKLHFLTADNLGSRVFDEAVTIKRSIFGTLTHADEGATYTPVSDDIISFQDNLVKSIVVKHFDTSKDGELSYREAAVVLSFLVDEADTRASDGKVSIFAGTDITTFDELVYFTGLTRIEDGTFAGCSKLESMTIPENIVAIGDNAFNGCTGLKSIVVMSSTPPAIGNGAFANSGDCPISVPEEAVDAYVSAWSEYKDRIVAMLPNNQIWYTTTDGQIVTPCNYDPTGAGRVPDPRDVFGVGILSNTYADGKGVIVFDGEVTTVGKVAFIYCSNLASIELPESVTSIGDMAFSGCSDMVAISIPKSLVSIGSAAFISCSSLKDIVIPASVTSIGERAFRECSGLKSIVVEDGNTVYDSRDNCNAIIETSTNTLIIGCANTVIPKSVKVIGDKAFWGCTSLTSITIPEGVISIGNESFIECTGLTGITIPGSVKTVGKESFMECTGLRSVVMGDGVSCIGSFAFYECSNLETVVLSESLTEIGTVAFALCSKLSAISIPESVEIIGGAAFGGCSSLTDITLGVNVKSIGEGAFYQCSGLTSITVLPTTPPSGEDGMFDESSCPIYVPASSLEAYLAAPKWSVYADRIQAIPSSLPNPEAIDLGLSVKWASFNLGATKPEEYGDYYAWGETEPYYSSLNPLTWKEGKNAGYDWASYKWCKGSNTTLTKYCNNAEFGYGGYTDDNLRLNPEDDAATANWGGEWRMPALEELEELDDKCTWEWTTQNGVNGYKITGPNSNSIFLPANGGFWESIRFSGEMCMYWSSSLYLFWGTDPDFAHVIFGDKSRHDFDDDDGENELGRFRGYAIRPVYGPQTIKYDVESLSLDKTKLELPVGETATLVATAFPEGAVNGSEYSIMWSSSDKNIATVSWLGVVKGVGVGTAIITAMSPEGKKATCEVTVQPSVAVPEAVDLGLSVKWASFNLGASKPEECGDYYAWGETEPYYSSLDPLTWKDNRGMGYDWMSYQWCVGSSDTIFKYTNSDGNTVLEPADDAAHVNLGKGWRMPTKAEQVELKNNCTWEWISNNGVDGYMVSGPNGNSIFLPVTGWRGGEEYWLPTYGIYWSSSLEQQRPYRAYGLYFLTDQINTRGYDRYYGQTIRPVCE